jgi:hypothetical protein
MCWESTFCVPLPHAFFMVSSHFTLLFTSYQLGGVIIGRCANPKSQNRKPPCARCRPRSQSGEVEFKEGYDVVPMSRSICRWMR